MAEQAPLTHSNALDDLVLVADVVENLKKNGLIALGADGHFAFVNPTTSQIAAEAADIVQLLKDHGVTVPANIERVLVSLPMLLPLLGVR